MIDMKGKKYRKRTGADLVFQFCLGYYTWRFGSIQRGASFMNEEKKENQLSWEEAHPWLSGLTKREEEDSVDEVIRYTLDELRFT